MRCLILGGDGMLGHQLVEHLSIRHDVRATLRGRHGDYVGTALRAGNTYEGLDVRDYSALTQVIADFQPEAVINAVGIVKQRSAAKDPLPSLEINALFPHRLLALCRAAGARLIHISTDCVFSGARGGYRETDPADAQDLYGRSKLLGEVVEPPGLTLRTSIIGLELKHRASLVEWFLAERGRIRGFDRAIFSGLTTLELARVIERVLTEQPDLHGLWHVASQPISKYELLRRLAARLKRPDVVVARDSTFHCDRSLDGSAFARRVGYLAPAWDELLAELAAQIHLRPQRIAYHDAA